MSAIFSWASGFRVGYLAGKADARFEAMFLRGLAERQARREAVKVSSFRPSSATHT
jgi:hypothetical protein